MPTLVTCTADTRVLIEGNAGGLALNLFIDIVGSVTPSGSTSFNSFPIPASTTGIDHAVRRPHRLSFNFIAGCRDCSGENSKMLGLIPALVETSDSQVYDTNFLNIYYNRGVGINFGLTSWTITDDQINPQISRVSLTFQAIQIQGNIAAPSLVNGGFLTV